MRPPRSAGHVLAGIVVLLGCLVLAGCTAPGHAGGKATKSTTVSSVVASAGPFPAVAGVFGDKPTLRFPSSKAPSAQLQRKVLRKGGGAVIATGDLIAVDYLGQIWRGAVFDNSYDRHVATTVQIGIGGVIQGWDQGLVGMRVGSRVELTIPPAAGYGSAGQSSAGIKGTDTLVFVVDIGRRYNAHSTASPDATPIPQQAARPQVSGALTAAPRIAIPKTVPPPTTKATYLIDRGRGPAIANGTAVIQYQAISWSGDEVGSTWENGTATSVPVGGAASTTGGLFDTLAGVPIGSRVLIVAPAPPGQAKAQNSVAVVIDVIGQVQTAKAMAAGV